MRSGVFKGKSSLWIFNLLLLAAPIALSGCDRAIEREASRSAAPEIGTASAPQPAHGEGATLSRKARPFILDLGGAKAAKAVGCALTVTFGSIGTGTDTAAKEAIEQMLEQDSAVAGVERFIIGREGETLLCVHLEREADRDRLFDALWRLASNAYMVAIRTAGGKNFDSPRKRL